MENRIDSSRWLLAFDLAIVAIWAVCACWCLERYIMSLTIVAPLIFMRFAISFTLYRRERNALWLVGGGVAIIALLFAVAGNEALAILLAPFTKFVETVWRFFSHDNSLMHGAYQLLAHPRETGIEGGGIGSDIALWILSGFLYFTPVVWSAALLATKRFENVKWPWKRILGYWCCYEMLSAGILVATAMYLPLNNGARWFWGIHPMIAWLLGSILIALPFMLNRHSRIHKEVKESSALLLVVIPLLAGIVMSKWGSLLAMLLCSAMMVYLLCQKWDGAKWDKSYWIYALVVPANICFWSSQFVIGFWRYALVFLSFAMVLAGAAFYYSKKHKPIKTLTLAVCLGVLIPFFSLGYNVLACTDARRIGNFDRYPYSWRGLLLVEGKDGIGIRDRYGMVIPPSYQRIEYMGGNSPYVKLMKNGSWNIADLETHALLLDYEPLAVKPVQGASRSNYRIWALEYEGNKSRKYFKAPRFHSRFSPDEWEISPSSQISPQNKP